MKEREKKVIESASFYTSDILNIDYKQTDFVYRSIKPYFQGKKGLELGPASGYMTQHLIHDFDFLEIVDGSLDMIEMIPESANLSKVHSMFEEYQPKDKFDTVIMSHVLEHVEKPVELLQRIQNWMEPNGVLIISVPNAKSIHRLVAVEMGMLKSIYELNERDLKLGHYRVYDSESLEKDAIRAGFKIESKGGSFLKPVSNGQIENNWNDDMIEGFYKVGNQFKDFCAEVFIVCKKN